MVASNDDEVIINLKLLKLCGYFDLIVPNGKTILGFHMNRLIFAIIICIIHAVVLYSNLGLFANLDYKISYNDFFLILFCDLIIFLTFYKTCLMFNRIDSIFELLDVTRIDFLTSKLCRKNNKILYGYRDVIKKYSYSYNVLVVVVAFQWVLYAFLVHVFFVDDSKNGRFTNVIDMPYPINTQELNEYYSIIFIIESIFIISTLYCTLMIDTLLLSYGWIITFQYEILGLAIKNLGYRKKRLTSNTILIIIFLSN